MKKNKSYSITKLVWIASILLAVFSFSPPKAKKVLFFGDSITYNGTSWDGAYINLIAKYAKENEISDAEFIGSGVPGDRVTDLYLRVEKDVLAQSPDIVVIFIGVNDIWHKILSGTGTDYKKFGKFYDALVIKLQNQNIQVVLCTPATIGEKTDFTNECDGDLNKYSQWIRDYASENNIPLVDLRKAFLDHNLKNNTDNKEKGILTADGVHLKPDGSKLVADEIWKELRAILK
jgi:lysophospholipase L1-like esterase